nr:MAG TPA: hypothetical protein [Bacteriophage sp.]
MVKLNVMYHFLLIWHLYMKKIYYNKKYMKK